MTDSEQVVLEQALTQLGIPLEKVPALATQLDKRAHQLAGEGERTYEQALMHLLELMKTAHKERTK
jgi:hypothetical protein